MFLTLCRIYLQTRIHLVKNYCCLTFSQLQKFKLLFDTNKYPLTFSQLQFQNFLVHKWLQILLRKQVVHHHPQRKRRGSVIAVHLLLFRIHNLRVQHVQKLIKAPHAYGHLSKNIFLMQPTTLDAPLKFLRHSTCGVKSSLTNAHVSDSSDGNSLDIPNAQPEKYNVNNPEDANTLDPSDGDINSGRIKEGNNLQNINSSSNINKEGEVIMEYQFPQTQQEQIEKKRNVSNDPPTMAKPLTTGAYSLIADSLHLLTV